jgi:hypothetical protein
MYHVYMPPAALYQEYQARAERAGCAGKRAAGARHGFYAWLIAALSA